MTGDHIALLSVSDKTGIAPFARGLAELGYRLVSTGGTLERLRAAGLAARSVEELTGFPEILGGRVKTLHPRIHGGLLAVRGDDEHEAELAAHGVAPIALVCVNLYPFEETIARPDATWEEGVENIDIGGPTLLRAAAKNCRSVWAVSDPEDYDRVLDALRSGAEGPSDALRRRLAQKAFAHTAAYDGAVARWLAEIGPDGSEAEPAGERSGAEGPADGSAAAGTGDGAASGAPPERIVLPLRRRLSLRYGENPHQAAAFYVPEGGGSSPRPTIAAARQLGGKQLSFNNINDADAALRLVQEFGQPAAVAVKHTNPCGVGLGDTPAAAFERAFRADDVSIFGGIVAFNRSVDEATAQLLASIFLEVIVAPAFDEAALDVLRPKSNLRLLETGFWPGTGPEDRHLVREAAAVGEEEPYDVQRAGGGFLVQRPDPFGLRREEWRTVTTAPVTGALQRQLEFAWLVCKHVKSNAIVLAKDDMTVGIGAGQTNRIDAARHAIARAAFVKGNPDGARGAVLASDAFFPFPDVVEAAAAAGVVAVVQPGGSMRDSASVEAANRAGMAMVFTGRRHFKH